MLPHCVDPRAVEDGEQRATGTAPELFKATQLGIVAVGSALSIGFIAHELRRDPAFFDDPSPAKVGMLVFPLFASGGTALLRYALRRRRINRFESSLRTAKRQ